MIIEELIFGSFSRRNIYHILCLFKDLWNQIFSCDKVGHSNESYWAVLIIATQNGRRPLRWNLFDSAILFSSLTWSPLIVSFVLYVLHLVMSRLVLHGLQHCALFIMIFVRIFVLLVISLILFFDAMRRPYETFPGILSLVLSFS